MKGSQPPKVGTLLYDIASDRVGEFRGTAGERWVLRPPAGGLEWEVQPQAVKLAGTHEQLRARCAVENAQRRTHRRA